MRTAILLLFSICVQHIPLAAAQEVPTATGTLLLAEESLDAAAGSGTFLEPPANTGAIVTEPEESTGATLSWESLPEEQPAPVRSPLLVRINEVLWAGSDLGTADEWLELTAVPLLTGATVTQPLSLEGWTVTQAKDGGETVIARFTSAHAIQSGGYLVVANYAAAASRLRHEPALVTSAMSVPNTKLLLRLRDGTGNLMDEADDGIGVPFAGVNPSGGIKASMERIDARLPGTLKENWRTADTARGLDVAASVRGTPGYPNGTVEPPDVQPPLDVTHARAFAASGALIALWTPSNSPDVARQMLEIHAADETVLTSLELPAASTGMLLEGAWPVDTRVTHRVIDDSGNLSPGIGISVQPLHKPIIHELLSDPPGSDEAEWIELFNPFDQPLDISGWTVRSGSRRYVFPPGTGSIIAPGDTRMLVSRDTGLTLPNAGGTIELLLFERVVERLSYPGMPEGVAYGWSSQEAKPICAPTPGGADASAVPAVFMEGFVSQGSDPLTLNLAAVASGGTLAGARCQWDFGDGYTYDGCNPPAHRMRAVGDMIIRLEAQDYCGNTMIQTQSVHVLQKANKLKEEPEMRTCSQTVSTGVVINEILPAPTEAESEWIELRHTGGPSLSLCGWSIDDREGGSKSYALDGKQLGSGEYLLLPREETGIALNNDQDIVRLIGPLPGGGTGVILSLPYQSGPQDQAYALRPDGRWLWTPFGTPGTTNRFEEVDMRPLAPIVELHVALPNPKGDDRYGEWVELRNPTMRPQWLNGWTLRTESRAMMDLRGRVIARKKSLRIPLEHTGMTLRNGSETLLLSDPEGQIRSVLSWKNVKDDQIVRQAELTPGEILENATLTDARHLRGRVVSSEGTEETLLTVPLVGFMSAPSNVYINEMTNFVSALIKDKKVELQNDSSSGLYHVLAEGADVVPILLRAGLAYVPGGIVFAKRLEYEAYEREARRQLRGFWVKDDLAVAVDERKRDEALDARALQEGLVLTSDPPSGIVQSGAVLTVTSSLPASLFLQMGTGAKVPFSGSMLIQDGTYAVSGEYRLRTTSGSMVRSTVTTREYALRKARYAACLKISEVSPSPMSGEREWVELRNICDTQVNPLGWSIDDESEAGSKPQIFGTGTVISSGGMLTLIGARLKITLNNDGDTVTLYDPRGRVSDSIQYPAVKKGRAYALENERWCLTETPTPSGANTCTLKAVVKKKASAKTARRIVGLGTKYASNNFGSPLTLNKESDRNFHLFEGLSINVHGEKEEAYILVYLLALAAIAIVLLVRLKK